MASSAAGGSFVVAGGGTSDASAGGGASAGAAGGSAEGGASAGGGCCAQPVDAQSAEALHPSATTLTQLLLARLTGLPPRCWLMPGSRSSRTFTTANLHIVAARSSTHCHRRPPIRHSTMNATTPLSLVESTYCARLVTGSEQHDPKVRAASRDVTPRRKPSRAT